ncbi:hypothetical protein YH66_11740 [[Brevibacterium] flavum]|uniref:Uncharacterized protein n=1 Tax=[Brevibacterium] flavum TaxID=92706 RepID=A0A0F6Z6E9_9CORY|nr:MULTISPECIES: hypothetical protein [Corynebacterium]AKF28175.1 hypothetical protein YH66_11740 [[Brevibacterium] flavum]ANE09005.1 hypothetical protein A3654_11810 [Corynebacterium glutamicum]AST21415.1 hypothetical protein CEY17_11910 [Corynebacterium glutamicum ATCC 14067]KEI23945.1 hypothetical protein KIQ_015705 [Corynebacterium glutamicum ATCC 14067]KIH72972.1 hypothetical protein SD36_11795 [Corynebacterium glutamicum]
MMPPDVTNSWTLLAFLGFTFITSFFGWISLKAKSGSDKKDEKAQPVLERVQATIDLQPAVNALSARVAACEEELAEYRPIAKIKYPLALNTIANFKQAYPRSVVSIPHQIRDDL